MSNIVKKVELVIRKLGQNLKAGKRDSSLYMTVSDINQQLNDLIYSEDIKNMEMADFMVIRKLRSVIESIENYINEKPSFMMISDIQDKLIKIVDKRNNNQKHNEAIQEAVEIVDELYNQIIKGTTDLSQFLTIHQIEELMDIGAKRLTKVMKEVAQNGLDSINEKTLKALIYKKK